MENINWAPVIGIVVAVLAAVAGFVKGLLEVRAERKAERVKIQQAESRLEAQPEKAKPAWDLARVTLESYFNRNLSQINYIFWLSVIVMTIGFGILIWGIWLSLRSSTVVVPAAIASVAGVLTEFIGATFLFIYRSTIEQAVNYSRTLERINSVGMAMQILDTMSDEVKSGDLKSKTKAELVELLVRQAYEATTGASKPEKE